MAINKIKNVLLPLIPFLLLIAFWSLAYYFSTSTRWLIPSPLKTADTLITLVLSGTLVKLVYISALNIFPAFFASLIFAVVVGVIIGINTNVRKSLLPFISSFYAIPSIAWLPFIILFFGFTRQSIWIVVFFAGFLRIIYSIISGVRNINFNWILAARNFGLNKKEVVYKIIIPGIMPDIITGAKLGFNSCWRSLIGAEMLITTFGGLGKFIWLAQWTFDFDKVFAGIAVIALIGIATEIFIFRWVEKITLMRWGFIQDELKP